MGRAYHFHDVGMFHNKFGLDNTTYVEEGPRPELPMELIAFRLQFLCEEVQETLSAAGLTFGDTSIWEFVKQTTEWNKQPIHAEVFDGLIDLVYVAYGLAHLAGYPWEEGWNLVQAANMAKERAQRAEQSTRGGTWDVIKPEGWTPPDIAGLLIEKGWK